MKQLIELAKAALKKHSDVDKALPHFVAALRKANLLNDLAREFLRSIADGEPGQGGLETQAVIAGLAPSEGSVKVRDYDVPHYRRRTTAEKQAADRAMLASIEAVFEIDVEGRPIGNLAMGELSRLKRDLVTSAVQGMMLHITEVRNAIIVEMIEKHCNVPDTLMRVRDAVDAKTLASFVAQAETQAPRRLEEALRLAREALETNKPHEIAA